MANTFILIETITVGSGGAASVTFSNIPQTYTDLKLLSSARGTQASVNQSYYINLNALNSNKTAKRVYGSGTGIASDSIQNIEGVGANATSNVFSNDELYIPNYTSSNAKSISVDNVTENNSTTAYALLTTILWNPSLQAAVTSIEVDPDGSTNFAQHSSFSLYGIKST